MSNHKAIIAAVTSVAEIPNANTIHVATVLGERVIVSKDVGVGSVGVFFPVDSQLSEEYCHENNLFRRAHLNKDNEKTGFFEENRRVRAQPFMKVRSEGYFAGIESLRYTGQPLFEVGSSFDEVNGKPLCVKYISKATREAIANANKSGKKLRKLAETPYFDKHVDSAQFKQNASQIPVGSLIHFHAKVHGTSHRSGLTKVYNELPKWKQLINKVAPVFAEFTWQNIVGTRNVVLDSPTKSGFHGSESFRFEVADLLKPWMDKGMTVYGEIGGYANGSPIMAVHNGKDTKDKAFLKKFGEQIVYKYGCNEGQYRFHIYRITYLNQEGQNVDFTQAQVDQWCKDRGFIPPYEVWPPFIYDGNVENLMDLVERLTERYLLDTADYIDPSHPSEGVILRIDTGKMNPYFLKSKSFHFRTMEGHCEAIDTEDAA